MVDLAQYYRRQEDQDERAAYRRQFSLENKRMTLMSNPTVVDRITASIMGQLSPTTRAPKKSEFTNQVDAIDSVIPEDHPLKGFGRKLSDVIANSLMDERTVGYSPMEIAQLATRKMLLTPGRSGVADIATEMYEYKREADASWFEGGDVKKPALPKGFKTYDEWRAGRLKAEKEAYAADPIWEPDKSTAAMIGASAAIGGLLGGPPGAVIGAAGGLLTDIVGSPFAHAVRHSEWYQAKRNRADTNWGDSLKAIAAEVSPYMLVGGQIDKSLMAALRTPKAVGASMKINLARPATVTSEVIEGGELIKASKEVLKDPGVMKRFVNRFFDDRGMKLGYNPEFIQGWKNAFAKQDKTAVKELSKAGYKAAMSNEEIITKYQGQMPEWDPIKGMPPNRAYATALSKLGPDDIEAAMKHPDGPIAGGMDAYNKMKYRELADIEKWEKTDELVGLASRESQEAAAKGMDIFSKAMQKTNSTSWDEPAKGKFFGFDPKTSKPIYYNRDLEPVPVEEPKISKTAKQQAAKRKQRIVSPAIKSVAEKVGPDKAKVIDEAAARSESFAADSKATNVLEKTSAVTSSEAMSASPQVSTQQAIVEAKSIAKPGAKWKAARKKIDERKAAEALKSEKESKTVVEEAVSEGKTARFKAVREAADEAAAKEREIREQFADIDPEGALKALSEYDKMLKAGEITHEEALELALRVQDGLAASDNITMSGMDWFADQTADWFTQLRRVVGNKTFLIMMGLGAGVYDMFSPDQAEAGMLSSVVKGLATVKNLPKAQESLIKAAKAARLTAFEVAEDTLVVPAKEFQVGLKGTATTGPAAFIRELPNLMRTIKSDFMGRKLMNPYQWMNMVLPGRMNLAINPGVYRASFSMAEYSNSAGMGRVIDNWVKK